MYQLAIDGESVDSTRLFIDTCTSMQPTPENMSLVRSASALVRRVLDGADIAPLRDFVRRAEQSCADVDDVLAAAGQTVIDEMGHLQRVNFHDVIRRVAQIERDAFAGIRRSMEGPVRAAYAG
jgi:hypothetical protein